MKKTVIKKQLRKWHKYLSFAFSLLIIYLSITGILLLYPQSLNIDTKFLNNSLVLKKYKMTTPEEVFLFTSKLNTRYPVVIIKNSLYLKKKFIDTFNDQIIGSIYNDKKSILFIFTADTLSKYFFDKNSITPELINIEETPLPYKINKIGANKKFQIYIETENKEILSLDKNLKENDDNSIIWYNTSVAGEKLALEYLSIHQGSGVSLHRIITELHNGKFFGSSFVFLLLLSTISIVFLVFSSFVFGINFRRRKNAKPKKIN